MRWCQWIALVLAVVISVAWWPIVIRPLLVRIRRRRSEPAACCDCRRNHGRMPRAATNLFGGRAVCAECYAVAHRQEAEIAAEVRQTAQAYDVPFPGQLVRRRRA